MKALHQIAAQIETLASDADLPEPFELRVIARKLEAQAEMIEKELHDAQVPNAL